MESLRVVFTSLLILTTPVLAAGEDEGISWDTGVRPAPIDSRNLSWPGLLLMGFEPAPATTLGQGNTVFGASYQHVSNYLASENVQLYLEERDDPRPLDDTDIAAITAFGEDAFFFDGEVARINLSGQFGLGDRLDLIVTAAYLSYTGGELDGLIFNFHENLGIDQNGRDLIARDQFQMLLSPDDGETFVHLDSPGGGLADPTVRVRWAFPGFGKGWRMGFEGGFKLPIGDERQLHSSGSFDAGVQLTAEKRWARSGLVLNGYWINAGDLEALPGLQTDDPLGLHVSLLRDLGSLFTGHVQVLSARSVFHGAMEASIADPEFQVTTGISARLAGNRRVTFAYTNNVVTHDSTPDTIFHVNFGQLFD
jgi:hypothetical protein